MLDTSCYSFRVISVYVLLSQKCHLGTAKMEQHYIITYNFVTLSLPRGVIMRCPST